MSSWDPSNLPEAPGSPPAPQAIPEEPIRVVIHKPWPTWTVWDLLLLVISFLIASFVAVPVVLGLARLLPAYAHQSMRQLSTNSLLLIPAQVLTYLLWLIPLWTIIGPKAGEPLMRAVAWRWPGPSRILKLFGSGLLLALAVEFGGRWLPMPKHLPIESYFQTTAEAYATALFGTIVAPFFEELFFRGLLYPWLKTKIGLGPAISFSALLFTLMHAPQLAHALAPLLLIFFVGVALTVIRERTGSLASSWAVHVGYNGTLFLIMYIATSGFRHLEQMQ